MSHIHLLLFSAESLALEDALEVPVVTVASVAFDCAREPLEGGYSSSCESERGVDVLKESRRIASSFSNMQS